MRPVRFLLAVGAIALACGCGGAVRDYPRWTFSDGADQKIGCVLGRAFIRMSGKTGVGITLQLRSLADCEVRFTAAGLLLDGEHAPRPTTLPATLTMGGRSLTYVWLPFDFDNNRAWNEGKRSGTFVIDLETNGAPGTWRLPAEHRFARRWQPE